MSERPHQAPGIAINEVADGYVVDDPARDRVHYLNHTAAIVLELCTGDTTIDQIVGLVQAAFELPDPPATEIHECVQQLQDEGLILLDD